MKNILGIDLGTSSVKMIYDDGEKVHKVKEKYDSISKDGWLTAIKKCIARLDLGDLRAVGLSSQVGTYLVDGDTVISWNDPVGREELDEILAAVPREDFVREIAMPHPHIISYPLPRLLYIKKHYPTAQKVCQPKDFLCEILTDNYVTDQFSYRGLAHLESGKFSDVLLRNFGLDAMLLPSVCAPTDTAGRVTDTASKELGIPAGTPVVVGCNDFFAGLLGMGIIGAGDAFDITGTSEHLGLLTDSIPEKDDFLVCGPYFKHNAHYGVTGSSGKSLDFGMELFDFKSLDIEKCLASNPPVFLPYLGGERAPIWDTNTRGVFFGISEGCDQETLSYSVLEGVCFSIYHIWETMGKPPIGCLTVSGGASKDALMNKMKASLFSCPVYVPEETDSSAFGAMMLASVGLGDYDSIEEAISKNCKKNLVSTPDKELGALLRERFDIYKTLYPSLKDNFKLLPN